MKVSLIAKVLIPAVVLVLVAVVSFFFGQASSTPSAAGHQHGAAPPLRAEVDNYAAPEPQSVVQGGQTTPVSAGPEQFQQAQPTGALRDYGSQTERCAKGEDYTAPERNPMLDEPVPTQFTSNLPLTVSVRDSGNQWYGERTLIFTNRSSTPFSLDCAVLTFIAADSSDHHGYFNSVTPFGHPEQDYLEIPRQGRTSHYVVRLGFRDVPAEQRIAHPGQSWEYRLMGTPTPSVTKEQTRDSIRFVGDLDLKKNEDLVRKYGTRRVTN